MLPVFRVTSWMVERRTTASPTGIGAKVAISPPAHMRRGSGTSGMKPEPRAMPSMLSPSIGAAPGARHQCMARGAWPSMVGAR